MIDPYKGKALLNLKKAQGQINLLQKMIEEQRYCVDVAQQVNATIGLLKRVNDLILEGHLNSCAAHKLNSTKQAHRQGFLKELIKNFRITS